MYVRFKSSRENQAALVVVPKTILKVLSLYQWLPFEDFYPGYLRAGFLWHRSKNFLTLPRPLPRQTSRGKFCLLLFIYLFVSFSTTEPLTSMLCKNHHPIYKCNICPKSFIKTWEQEILVLRSFFWYYDFHLPLKCKLYIGQGIFYLFMLNFQCLEQILV